MRGINHEWHEKDTLRWAEPKETEMRRLWARTGDAPPRSLQDVELPDVGRRHAVAYSANPCHNNISPNETER
jgi:acyl-CoA synthetase (AMP-forming)/AMP-acid ligase II